MMSITGNKKGFTLVEVMVAAAVLSFGIVMVYQAFFVVLDSYNYYSNYLEVASWVSQKVWEAQDAVASSADTQAIQNSGDFTVKGKRFAWTLTDDVLSQSLHRLNLVLSWRVGKRDVSIKRTAFSIYEKKQ